LPYANFFASARTVITNYLQDSYLCTFIITFTAGMICSDFWPHSAPRGLFKTLNAEVVPVCPDAAEAD